METADAPIGLLGTAPANDVFAVVVAAVFLPKAAERLEEDLTSFATRCEALPGRALEAPAEAEGFIRGPPAFGLTLDSAATGLPMAFELAAEAASFATSSACDGAGSVMLPCNEEDSAVAAAASPSLGSVVSMLTPSGFITSLKKVWMLLNLLLLSMSTGSHLS